MVSRGSLFGVVVVALLAVLGASCATAPEMTQGEASSLVHGTVAPGFEEVRAEFEKSFRERGELGAAVAVYWRGEKVVDLWGGHLDKDKGEPWREDTLVVFFSTTKGIGALALAMLHARGLLAWDEPVATYWPEFAQNGKEKITVRQLLGHEAGLVLLDEELPVSVMSDLDHVATVLARQKPQWVPGSKHGYHAATIGLYMGELVRRVDPAHRSIGRFVQDEIVGPLGDEFYIGLPSSVPSSRLATMQLISPMGGMTSLGKLPPALRPRILTPWSLFNKSLGIPKGYSANDRASLEIELAAGNGVGTARAMAHAFHALVADEGTPGALGLTGPTRESLFADPVDPPAGAVDEVMGIETWWSLGYLRPSPSLDFGSSRRVVASAGAGGSFALADADQRLSFAYVMNKMDYYMSDDPREKSLRDAVYRAVAKLEASRPVSPAPVVSSAR